MNFHIVLGFLTIIAGMTLVAIGTNGGQEIAINVPVILGSVMVMLGSVRVRKGFWLRKQK